jgi:hypothetical protein
LHNIAFCHCSCSVKFCNITKQKQKDLTFRLQSPFPPRAQEKSLSYVEPNIHWTLFWLFITRKDVFITFPVSLISLFWWWCGLGRLLLSSIPAHFMALLMHFFSSYQYILFPCLEFYPLLLKCKTLLQFYVSTSCTDYWA